MDLAPVHPGIEARIVSEDGYDEWRRVLSDSAEGSPYQLPEYLAALTTAAGGRFNLVGVYNDGNTLIGGIGLYEPSGESKPVATSRYMLYYNEPFVLKSKSCVTSRLESDRRKVLLELLSYFSRLGYRTIRFKSRCPNADFRPMINAGWSVRPVYSYLAEIHDMDRLWKRMDRNARRQVQQARKSELIFTEYGSFSSFFDMHVGTHLHKGSPVYLPRRRYERFVASLLDNNIARLFQVSSRNGEPLATQLVLFGAGQVAHTLCAGSNREVTGSGCNPYLRWRVFEWLAAEGYQALDLTDAQNESVSRFKVQLGADLRLGLELTSPESALRRVMTASGRLSSRVAAKLSSVLVLRDVK